MSQTELSVVKYRTLGFGPFSLLGWQFIPDHAGLRLHHWLQKLADQGVPILPATGTQQLVLSRRGSASGESS